VSTEGHAATQQNTDSGSTEFGMSESELRQSDLLEITKDTCTAGTSDFKISLQACYQRLKSTTVIQSSAEPKINNLQEGNIDYKKTVINYALA
jgi:hypothetical protein